MLRAHYERTNTLADELDYAEAGGHPLLPLMTLTLAETTLPLTSTQSVSPPVKLQRPNVSIEYDFG